MKRVRKMRKLRTVAEREGGRARSVGGASARCGFLAGCGVGVVMSAGRWRSVFALCRLAFALCGCALVCGFCRSLVFCPLRLVPRLPLGSIFARSWRFAVVGGVLVRVKGLNANTIKI